MKKLLLPIAAIVIGLGGLTQLDIGSAFAQPEPPKGDKAGFGDKDETVLQNQRLLQIRNDTKKTITVFVQYRAYVNNVWTWLPDDPKNGTTAISFEVETGQEVAVKDKGEPIAGSRMRVWAQSDDEKWLAYKTKDAWLVPERNENGEHVYAADAIQPYTFVFSSSAKAAGDLGGEDEKPGQIAPPSESGGMPVPPPPPESFPGGILPGDVPGAIPWDEIPPGAGSPGGPPIIRDLSVLPVLVTGGNATIRVMNRGHLNSNLGRRLFVRKLIPGALPSDQGPIGLLFHNGIKTFPLLGLAPGTYEAYVSPGDDPPFHGNDKKIFTIAMGSYSDLTVLPVFVAGGNVHIKVKNVGTAPSALGQTLKVVKLAPGAIPIDHGPIGVLAVNGFKSFAAFPLPAGTYKAFISVGDPVPYHANDQKIFVVPAAGFADLDILPIFVVGGNVHLKVKNIGTAPTLAGQHLKVVKLAPGAIPVDHGAIGVLGVDGVKVFPAFPLVPGNYKAFISPGDAPPYHGNDSDTFVVVAVSPDLEVSIPVKIGLKVKATIKNNALIPYPAGVRTWHLEKWNGAMWLPIPTIGSHVIPAIGPGGTHEVQGNFLGAGDYRIRITPGDANAGNDVKTKMLP